MEILPENSTPIIIEKSTRLHHLDSLRGIAAIAVAVYHSYTSFIVSPRNDYFAWTLLGKSPVIFFFLLSGFVLSRSLLKSHNFSSRSIAAYSIRRIFRLYPAVLFALALGIIASKIYMVPADWTPSSIWFVSVIHKAQTVTTWNDYLAECILRHVKLVPQLWTIRVELLCSLLLPLFIFLEKRFPYLQMPITFLLILLLWRDQVSPFDHINVGIGYLLAFQMGYLINKASASLYILSEQASKWILFFCLVLWIFSVRYGCDLVTVTIILSAIFAVLIPCNWPNLMSVLESSPLRLLGKISYSFYLIHLPVLLVTWTIFEKISPKTLCYHSHIIPTFILCVSSIGITIPIAMVSERFVERSCNNWGHQFSKKLLNK